MTEFTTRQQLARVAEIVPAPTRQPFAVRNEIDRGFELPAGLYVATVAAYLAFVAVMAGAFMNPGLVLPTAIFAIFIAAAFGVPMLWARMKPEHGQRAMTFQQFRNRGVQTATGHLGGMAAAVQVLILPVLILAWGVAVAIIAALPG